MASENSVLDELERINALLNKGYFDVLLGNGFSEREMTRLERDRSNLARSIISDKRSSPKLYQYLAREIALSNTSREFTGLLQRKNDLHISVKGSNIYWRDFFSRQKNYDSPETSSSEFTSFCREAKYLFPLVKKRFILLKKSMEMQGTSIKEYFETMHRLSLDSLNLALIDKKKFFSDCPLDISNTKYFRSEFYSIRKNIFGKIDQEMDNKIWPDSDRLINLFDLDKKKLIFTERANGKYPHPYCALIKIPDDIQVYIPPGLRGFDAFYSLIHELGHAFQFTNLSSSLSFEKKYCRSIAQMELHPIYFQNLLCDTSFLTEILGIKPRQAFVIKKRLLRLKDLTERFYTINSIFKIELWKDIENADLNDLNSAYRQLHKEILGFDTPDNYWLLHHMLPVNFMHSPSIYISLGWADRLDTELSCQELPFGMRIKKIKDNISTT